LNYLLLGVQLFHGNPTENMLNFLTNLKDGQLNGVKAATFDTRVKLIHGDAAKKIAQELERVGAKIISSPGYFYVRSKEGPLFRGETEKAANWAKLIKSKI